MDSVVIIVLQKVKEQVEENFSNFKFRNLKLNYRSKTKKARKTREQLEYCETPVPIPADML